MIPKKRAKLRGQLSTETHNTVECCKADLSRHTVILNRNADSRSKEVPLEECNIAERFLDVEKSLASQLSLLSYGQPICNVYNPIDYAFKVHSLYVHTYCQDMKKIMLLGMNPGPWGMAQTGVPFGEVNVVREWMGIFGEVNHPLNENPARPILGFNCHRSEISGQRFWGLFKELCGEAKNFYRNCIVYNYCPITFMTESGKNVTPSELKLEVRNMLHSLCDEALFNIIMLYQVNVVIAIGKYAEKRVLCMQKSRELGHVKVACIPHPSPRNFHTSSKWRDSVMAQLQNLDLLRYFREGER